MNPLPPWWEMQCEDFYLHCELNEDYNDVTLTHHTTDGNGIPEFEVSLAA